MAKNFNVDPYYDDFNASKNFHRILFKPGYAVQARELTQSQTILQDQISKFADHVFKQNSPVTGGNVTSNLNCRYLKLQQTYSGTNINVTDFLGKLIRNGNGLVVANVIAVSEPTGDVDLDGNYLGDPPTLILSYRSGDHFQDNDVIYDSASNLAAQAIAVDADGESSVVSINTGVFYVNGNFVQVNPQTTILSKYSNTPSLRVGLFIDESIVDFVDDTSLLDPALGASNYQAPGADRFKITLTLTTRPLQLGDDDGFIELVRYTNGQMLKLVDGSVYSVIDDYFAKRTFETNGDYTVTDFKLTPKTNSENSDTYIMSVGKGVAYVKGYRVENIAPFDITSNRSRTTESQNNNPVFTDFGSYLYVTNVHGSSSNSFYVTTSDTIDLHCVNTANVKTGTANSYNSTLVGSAYIRGLNYDNDNNSLNANNWTYKLYVNDIQTNTLTGNLTNLSSTTNVNFYVANTSDPFLSDIADTYVGMTIKLTSGTNAGETRTITSYNPTSNTANVNIAWSVAPDSTTRFSIILATKDTESVLKTNKVSYPILKTAYGDIATDGKVGGISSGDTVLENPLTPELIFPIGYSYVSSVADTSYTSYQQVRGKTFTAAAGVLSTQISFSDYSSTLKHIGTPGQALSSDAINENFTIVVTNAGSSSLNVGDIVPWTTLANVNRSIEIDATGTIATIRTSTSDLLSFTADILVKCFVANADSTNYILKTKELVTANANTVVTNGTQVNTNTYVDDSINSSGQIYIKKAAVVAQNQKQSLYLSDVKRVIKIIDTRTDTLPTLAMLSDPENDITSYYDFDNGQRDSFYDHASISLRPGAPKPTGNILVLVDYYKHSGGDGYFDVNSYTSQSSKPEEYRQIPNYTSAYGSTYALRDCLDFRPARLNAQSSFVFRYANPGDTTRFGTFLPVDLGLFYCGQYNYYLGRKDKLIINKDREISILEGVPSINPIFPTESEGSLVLANLTHRPYTGYIPTELFLGVSDLSIEMIQHKRYTMQDISELEGRINRIEYYTSLNTLEQAATGIQIQDAYGLNRFKNGILVDDFSSFETVDSSNPDFRSSLNRRLRQVSSIQGVNNYSLTNLLMAYNMNSPSTTLQNSLSYKIRKSGLVNNYLLPYTTDRLINQFLASRTVNVNPFAVTTARGVLGLSPNVDNWVDTNYNPSILITAPGLQIYSNTLLEDIPISLLSVGDWQTISSTKTLESRTTKSQTSSTDQSFRANDPRCENRSGELGCFVNTQTTQTTTTSVYNNILKEQRNFTFGPYSSITNTYSMNNGFVTDVSILPYIRKQEITLSVHEMLINTKIYNFFDNVSVDKYIKKPNVVELVDTQGDFFSGDIVGYKPTPSTFVATGKVVGVYNYPASSNVRLYVTSDAGVSSYYGGVADFMMHTASFDSNNQYVSGNAHGKHSSNTHYSGAINPTQNITYIGGNRPTILSSNTVILSPGASSVNGYYTGNTLFINAGTGAGQYATITAYNGSTKTANLSSTLSYSNRDLYTIGTVASGESTFKTNESGSFFGIFYVPENVFQNGQRTFRIDNRINNNITTATTFAEATFYATGLQATKQRLDFGASPGQYEIPEYRTKTWKTTNVDVSTQTTRTITPNDPVAQTFIIDSDNYPNGVFLSSIKVFFRTKPTQNMPVTLSIVGTLNGYPNGEVLPNSYVTLNVNQVKTSEIPHYLDSNTYTLFEFDVPVFIQPDLLYAFVVKSLSNEYEAWTALNSDIALSSSVKNLPTDPAPSVVTKISAAPYIGALFLSQNSQTWTADQNQSLMFVVERCVFDTSKTPTIRFVTPKGLPQRQILEQSIDYFNNANSITTTVSNASNTNVLFDAFNVSTTDLIPSRTNINYSFNATLEDGSENGQFFVDPGKYGTTMYDHVYLNDGKGRRQLFSNNSTSFSLYAQLTSTSDAVSPIISESGLTLYTIKNAINNCELSNTLINIINGGSNYSTNANVVVTVSAPTGKNGVQAFAKAEIDPTNSNTISRVYFTSGGSGYVTTPTITISDANTTQGTGALVTISGETSTSGGPAYVKYLTKKVVLDQGFDSGDLNVYMTAYRPLNTDILVYYKILNRDDTQRFEDSQWQLMTKIKNTDTLYSYSRNEVFEFVFAPGEQDSNTPQGYVTYQSSTGQIYDEFNQYALKIVLTSTDKTFCPYVSDLRCIALLRND